MKIRFSHAGFVVAWLCPALAAAQAFSSGSTGSDGALSYTTPGTYTFNPAAFNPPLDPAGDNIFNFTTINIASGVTLNFPTSYLRNKPVIWLATGNVTIAGTLVLDGASGVNLGAAGANWITQRMPTEPGPGGYPGGVGALQGGVAASAGLGPGGAPVQTSSNCAAGGAASFSAAAGSSVPAASAYGNIELVPLLGGSGGSGGCVPSTATASDAAGGTGGSGGGAIRIVSSSTITLTGLISAQGGAGGTGRNGGTNGGPGTGGAINLIAPTVTGAGTMVAANGGYILINATTFGLTGSGSSPTGLEIVTVRPLLAPPLPTLTMPPTITINSISAVSVPQPPLGQFLSPDVTINSTSGVSINISAVGVPVGTVVQLQVLSELNPEQTISCAPLAGTTANSTATCTASFPTGVSAVLASAVW